MEVAGRASVCRGSGTSGGANAKESQNWPSREAGSIAVQIAMGGKAPVSSKGATGRVRIQSVVTGQSGRIPK
jgi:hypothetical protein